MASDAVTEKIAQTILIVGLQPLHDVVQRLQIRVTNEMRQMRSCRAVLCSPIWAHTSSDARRNTSLAHSRPRPANPDRTGELCYQYASVRDAYRCAKLIEEDQTYPALVRNDHIRRVWNSALASCHFLPPHPEVHGRGAWCCVLYHWTLRTSIRPKKFRETEDR